MAAAATATTTADTSAPNANAGAPVTAKALDYNPRFKGYVYIIFTSLVCFASLSNIFSKRTDWAFSVCVGVVTFSLSLIILILDRFQSCFESISFQKSMDGKLEGATLAFFVCWWIAGVAVITRVDGIGYRALNIYFSAWLSLASCVYTLNMWSGSKDILTIQELTAVSTTLRGWFTLNFSAIVVLGSAINMHHYVKDGNANEASFSAILGALSLIVSAVFILAHYRVIERVPVGGWAELGVSMSLGLFWIIAVGVLTQDEGIAASINGDCGSELSEDISGAVPGSNLYVFCWLCLVAVIDVSMQWKAAQALSFAQASKSQRIKVGDKNEGDADDDDDDDDEL